MEAVREDPGLIKGGRCRLSAEGRKRLNRGKPKSGIVLNPSSRRHPSCARVMFDGSKTPITLHRDFLEAEPCS